MMKYFSMFSGIGGFELGIQRVCSANKGQSEMSSSGDQKRQSKQQSDRSAKRLSCIGFSEIDKYAKQIYKKHFKGHRDYGDATRINTNDLPDFDFLCGGFPCQSFSIAGKRAGMSGEDIRGTLFFEIWRILRDKRPKLFLLENVPGLLSSRDGQDFQTILASLDEIGYDVEWDCCNSKNFGVPQNRERVFIVGHLRGECGRKVFPLGETNRIPISETGRGVQQPTAHCLRDKQGKRYSSETFIRTSRIRRLTPTECCRLQGFPDDWVDGISDSQKYKCLGNAVTVNVIEAIVRNFLDDKHDGEDNA